VEQAESDGVLDDVATMIGCTRSNLHVVASDKGLVVGRIQFEEDGDPIDCTRYVSHNLRVDLCDYYAVYLYTSDHVDTTSSVYK